MTTPSSCPTTTPYQVLGAAGEGKTEPSSSQSSVMPSSRPYLVCVRCERHPQRKVHPLCPQAAHPYKPYIFAPGKKYSDSLDFLGFLEDHNDDLTAGATVTTFFDNVIVASDGRMLS
ncbi:hypothetical protein ON05_036350 (plasmid) [Acaryochloris sp. CCMEE 5410]|nr:hypothetical protein ON05_036350 [Acaryochloris sp. CCMEE 5410]